MKDRQWRPWVDRSRGRGCYVGSRLPRPAFRLQRFIGRSTVERADGAPSSRPFPRTATCVRRRTRSRGRPRRTSGLPSPLPGRSNDRPGRAFRRRGLSRSILPLKRCHFSSPMSEGGATRAGRYSTSGVRFRRCLSRDHQASDSRSGWSAIPRTLPRISSHGGKAFTLTASQSRLTTVSACDKRVPLEPGITDSARSPRSVQEWRQPKCSAGICASCQSSRHR